LTSSSRLSCPRRLPSSIARRSTQSMRRKTPWRRTVDVSGGGGGPRRGRNWSCWGHCGSLLVPASPPTGPARATSGPAWGGSGTGVVLPTSTFDI
jgi:hypothetical protein